MKRGAMKRAVVVAIGIGLAGSACHSKEGAKVTLPAASGEGQPAASIPNVADLMKAETPAQLKADSDISGTGTLYARVQAELGPKVTGQLAAVTVAEGDTVKKGQVVFRTDSAAAGLMVQQAETQVASADTNLRSVTLELTRAKELNARGSLPVAALEQIQARYDAASDMVAQAKVAVSMAKRSVSDTVVTSPITGVVTARNKEPGETVTMMPVTVVLVVQDIAVLELRVRLPEGALKTIAVGKNLKVTFPAIGAERTVPVKRINPVIDVATRTVEIFADLDNADQSLKPGMLANVTVADGEATGATPAETPPTPKLKRAPSKGASAKPNAKAALVNAGASATQVGAAP